MIDRRAFLRASLAVACAPMIVRAGSLMKVRRITLGILWTTHPEFWVAMPPLWEKWALDTGTGEWKRWDA